ncbi:MAG: hypothetical protein VYD19_08390 [Myxococcota bacterium]|nr:hypothetical protein [Myxococcota bacterium]
MVSVDQRSGVVKEGSTQAGSIDGLADKLSSLRTEDAAGEQLTVLSRGLANHFFILLRSASIYALDNAAMVRPREKLMASIEGLHQLLKAPLSLRLLDGNFFLNQRQLELDFGTYQNCRSLRRLFELLRVNEAHFPLSLRAADLEPLLNAFCAVTQDQAGSILSQDSGPIRFRRLEVGKLHPLLVSETESARVLSWFASALSSTQRFVDDLRSGRPLQFSILKRLALDGLNLGPTSWPRLLMTSLFPEGTGSAARYMVDALALSVVLGGRLGLSIKERRLFSLVALQHPLILLFDHPEAAEDFFPALLELLERPETELQERRLRGLHRFGERAGLSDELLQRLVLSFELFRGRHSQAPYFKAAAVEGGKTSALYSQKGLSAELFSELLRVSLFYLAHRQKAEPAEALHALKREESLSAEGRALFEQALGAYPIGSFVTLSDRREGLVVSFPQGATERPLVLPIKPLGELIDPSDPRAAKIMSGAAARPGRVPYFFQR